MGANRTATQDPEFTINQLVELALRALSPGINDPFTTIACIDYLGAILQRIDRCGMPDHRIRDEDRTIRVVLRKTGFEGILGAAIDQIRQQSASHPAVLLRLLEMLTALLVQAEHHHHRDAIKAQAEMVVKSAREILTASRDLEALEERIAALEGTPPAGEN